MSSNFFAQQDLARRNTRLLVALFSVAVLVLLLLTNVIVMVGLGFIEPNALAGPIQWHTLSWPIITAVSATVLAAVGIAILVKWLQLRAGGKVVAESLGGTRLAPDSQDPLQRRLLNVVEEMALAANTPVPPVYLLPERGINAFAAGYSPADAVIGVTQGCIEQLTRDELQGVVAHEFSHILNGDMRMNIRLIAILNGILFLGHIGYYMLRGGSHGTTMRRSKSGSDKNGGSILLVALGLVIIGYLGSFFGNLIKAAVSRQREFLADASAVKFTRNPRGIAGALKVIGSQGNSSKIRNQNADENSHLFFGEAISRWASVFATHPPLSTRIKRLEPHWNGKYPSARAQQTATEDSTQTTATLSGSEVSGSLAEPVSENNSSLSNTERLQQTLPLLLLHSSRQSEPAAALVCCLLLQPEDPVHTQQLQVIKTQGSLALLQQVDQLCDSVANLNPLQQVQLLQRVMPALKALDKTKIEALQQLLQALLNCSASPTLGAWIAKQFVTHCIAVQYDKNPIVRQYSNDSLSKQAPAILALLALVSSAAGDDSAQQQAWQAGLSTLPFTSSTSRQTPQLDTLSEQLPTLLALPPQQKQQLWQAIEACVRADQLLQLQEQALLLALALMLQVPYQPD